MGSFEISSKSSIKTRRMVLHITQHPITRILSSQHLLGLLHHKQLWQQQLLCNTLELSYGIFPDLLCPIFQTLQLHHSQQLFVKKMQRLQSIPTARNRSSRSSGPEEVLISMPIKLHDNGLNLPETQQIALSRNAKLNQIFQPLHLPEAPEAKNAEKIKSSKAKVQFRSQQKQHE